MSKNVIVIGASDNPERYSYQAVKLLEQKGYNALPVHPKLSDIEGTTVYPSIKEIQDLEIDTISIYVNPNISSTMTEEIIQANPRRVIFNPNTENSELRSKLKDAGIETIEACTLVMLRTNQF